MLLGKLTCHLSVYVRMGGIDAAKSVPYCDHLVAQSLVFCLGYMIVFNFWP